MRFVPIKLLECAESGELRRRKAKFLFSRCGYIGVFILIHGKRNGLFHAFPAINPGGGTSVGFGWPSSLMATSTPSLSNVYRFHPA
jgi:hypothetical protein